MSYELINKLKRIEPYEPVCGSFAVRLDANESCFDLSEKVRAEIAETLGTVSFNRYPDHSAADVTKAFASYYGLDASLCTAGNGSDELISLIMGSFLGKGDKVLTLSPDFSMYEFYGHMEELNVVSMQKDEDLSIDISKVIDYCNSNDIKALIFSNPCNPTSLGVCREEILRLIKNASCLVIVDEAYMDFWSESVADAVQANDNLIVLKTCSKNLGMAALRLGFAVAGSRITNAVRAAKSPYNVNALTQAIGSLILKNKEELNYHTQELINSRISLYNSVCDSVREYSFIENVYDSVTNFVFIRTTESEKIFRSLLSKGIAIRYMGDYLRITAGTEQENAIFISAFKGILSHI